MKMDVTPNQKQLMQNVKNNRMKRMTLANLRTCILMFANRQVIVGRLTETLQNSYAICGNNSRENAEHLIGIAIVTMESVTSDSQISTIL